MIEPFVSLEWVVSRRPNVVLADVRWYLDGRSGRAAFEAGHAPGAVYIDLDEALAGPPSPERGRHPLPEPAVFAAAMARAGISDDTTVVAYDDAGGVIAARLVWLLRATGHDAALLDGGVAVFGTNVDTGPNAATAAGAFTARPWPRDRLATIDDAVGGTGVVIDARNRDRFDGAPDPVDPRFGHIPGAHSVPCRENVVDGFVKSPAQLRATFDAAGVTEGASVISYCGSGVTACHNLLTLEWAGLGQGRLFPGSWSQYSNDLSRPIA